MEEVRCPFCLEENIKFIDEVAVQDLKKARSLMECYDCKKFFWDDNGKEIVGLHDLCETLMLVPFKCNKKVRSPLSFSFSEYRSLREFDLICSECPNRHFLFNEERLKF